MKTRLVVKLIAVLVLLLSVVLYKMNDFYKQEKIFQAESQVHKQIISVKTAVSSQLSTLRNTLSSYDVEIKENKINWVQLDPFFGIARLQKKSDGAFSVLQFIGRSGTQGERWNTTYLEKALAVRKTKSDQPIQARLFKDRNGSKFITLIYSLSASQQIAVVGTAEYFQKYFDIERGGTMTAALLTSDHILVAHSESDYVATASDEDQLSGKKYIIEKEEIAGTNLVAISYVLRKSIAASWMIPWSVVCLIFGFGFVLIGLLFYGLDPLDKKIERYKKQERETIFKETVQSEILQNHKEQIAAHEITDKKDQVEAEIINKTRTETVVQVQEAFAEPTGELAEATLNGPLQQALFNLDSILKQSQIKIEKDISTRIEHPIFYGAFIKSFENILRNAIEALNAQDGKESQNLQAQKKITIRAYDVDQITIIEIQDNGVGLGSLKQDMDKVWQPFFTTKPKSQHMGLGLTEALSVFRRCRGDLSIEPMQPEGVLVKMILKKQKFAEAAPEIIEDQEITALTSAASLTATLEKEIDLTREIEVSDALELDLDEVLSLDEVQTEYLFAPQKINLNTNSEQQATQLRTPNLSVTKKAYDMDQFPVAIRRPNKS